jgi:hypothetical protein
MVLQVMASLGLAVEDLLPAGPYAQSPQKQTPSFLALELFDNTDFDCRNCDEWATLGMEDGLMKGVPARTLAAAPTPKHDRVRRDRQSPASAPPPLSLSCSQSHFAPALGRLFLGWRHASWPSTSTASSSRYSFVITRAKAWKCPGSLSSSWQRTRTSLVNVCKLPAACAGKPRCGPRSQPALVPPTPHPETRRSALTRANAPGTPSLRWQASLQYHLVLDCMPADAGTNIQDLGADIFDRIYRASGRSRNR